MNKLLFLLCLILFACSGKKTTEADFNLIPVKSGKYWGYVDHEGKFKVNPQFDLANPFYEGLALISTDGKYGFINDEGKYVINSVYKNASNFANGLALVVKENSKLEFINTKGETKITLDPAIEKAHSFREGLALVYMNNSFGYITDDGKISIPATFSGADDFSDGLARVAQYDSLNKETKYGFINKKGELAISYQFKYAYAFKNGLAMVSTGSQYGYIGHDGKFIINPQFDNVSNFIGDYASIKQGDLSGFIDKKGKIIINPQFKSVDMFYDNDIAAVVSTDGKYGFIDKGGKYVINPQFDYASRFYNDMSIIYMGQKYGMIDRKGKITVNPQFDNINAGSEENSWVTSDYFDVTNVVSYILESVTDKSFNGFSAATTFKDIQAIYPNINEYNYSEFENLTPKANAYIQLRKISTSYTGGLTTITDNYSTQQVYDPVAGGYTNQKVYTGSQTNLNPNATLSDIAFLYFPKGRARDKTTEIVKELHNKLTALGFTFNGSTPNSGTFNKGSFVIMFWGPSSVEDHIILKIYFNADSNIEMGSAPFLS